MVPTHFVHGSLYFAGHLPHTCSKNQEYHHPSLELFLSVYFDRFSSCFTHWDFLCITFCFTLQDFILVTFCFTLWDFIGFTCRTFLLPLSSPSASPSWSSDSLQSQNNQRSNYAVATTMAAHALCSDQNKCQIVCS